MRGITTMTQYTAANRQFFQLFEHLTDPIIVIDTRGIIVYINENAKNLFSLKNEHADGRHVDTILSDYTYSIDEGTNKQKCFGISGQSQLIKVKVTTQQLTIEDVQYKIMIIEDLQRNKSEQLKNVSKELANIKLALDKSTMIAITDPKGNFKLVNQKFCDLSKYNVEELIGENFCILNSNYHPKQFFRHLWKTIRQGEIWQGEILNKAKDGSLYWVETTIVPFLDDDGRPYQYFSVSTDITKRVTVENQLQEVMKVDFIETMKNLQNGIFKMKMDGKGRFIYTMAAGKLLDAIGADEATLLHHTPHDVFPKEIADLKYRHYKEAFKGNRVNYEVELEGRLVFVDITPIVQEDAVIEIVGSVHDISELRSTQRELQVNQFQYQSLFQFSQDYVISVTPSGEIIDMNPNMLELYKNANGAVPYLTLEQLVADEDKEMTVHYFQKAIEGNPQNFDVNVQTQREKFVFNVTFLPIIVDKQIKGVYSIGKDITEQRRIQEINEYLAHHDELTKLPNRRWIVKKLDESLQQAEKMNLQLAVLFIDLDRFKSINDTLGHLIGDQLLEEISSRLLDTIDRKKQHLARLGGDEFMVLCPVIDKQEEVINLAKNLLEKLSTPLHIDEYELMVSTSIGISFFPTSGITAVDLMKKADIALYQAKEQGRNMYQVYTNSMDDKQFQRFFMERDLRKAIMNEEFIAHFQPRVDALTGKTIGAEALIRWMHPTYGLVSPGEFIPLAEETGLIIPLGKWMKRQVCEQLVAWRNANIPLIPISVNISSQRFLQSGFAQDLRDLLAEYELDGHWIELEITENSLMKNEEYIYQTLLELKEMGVKIYIDDFGTGYSSFHYLKAFKLDGIKIDMSFIKHISCQSENAPITAAMIKMAQQLNMDVIAEGVETKEELAFLLEQNCHHIQGFYYGRPCAAMEFEKMYL